MKRKDDYPFRYLDLNIRNIRSINGWAIQDQKHFWTWSMGKVYYINEDIDGKIFLVWVQIHLYYPTPMVTPLILPCRLSENLSTHSIWQGDYVVLEYDANVEHFKNRTFSIIEIEKQ